MNFQFTDLIVVLPELLVLGMACLILVVDLFLTDRQRVFSYVLTQFTVVAAFALLAAGYSDGPNIRFSGMFVRDGMADVLKMAVMVMSFGAFLYSHQYLKDRDLFKGEYYVLGLFGVLGMMVMISAHSFLTIYMGLELLSLSLYAMVAFNRNSRIATEAAMKYFMLGAVASGMLLYGMSLLYGITGTLDIAEAGKHLAGKDTDIVMLLALVFVIAGLAFKLGAVPFHMWLPDVYHGAPTSVTLFIGSAPKIAAFALFMRLLAESLGGLHADWINILAVLSVLSLAIGNVIAIAQTNIKRMLAYSTISHVGFLLMGILAGTPDGYSAAMFYVISYALMALGAFGMVVLLSRKGLEAERLDDFKGLNERSPWFAFIMLILMFSMAGVPPTVGFYAKLVVIKAVIDVDMLWLAIVAVLFSVIGAFYYIRVVKLMYFDAPEDSRPLRATPEMQVMLTLNGLAVLAIGLFPDRLMALCLGAI